MQWSSFNFASWLLHRNYCMQHSCLSDSPNQWVTSLNNLAGRNKTAIIKPLPRRLSYKSNSFRKFVSIWNWRLTLMLRLFVGLIPPLSCNSLHKLLERWLHLLPSESLIRQILPRFQSCHVNSTNKPADRSACGTDFEIPKKWLCSGNYQRDLQNLRNPMASSEWSQRKKAIKNQWDISTSHNSMVGTTASPGLLNSSRFCCFEKLLLVVATTVVAKWAVKKQTISNLITVSGQQINWKLAVQFWTTIIL